MEDCLFCMIAEGKIPSKKLYEDEQVVAFYDINPQAKVHFLVVPKKHIVSAAALTEEDGALLGHIFAVIAKLAAEQGLNNGYRVISNVGEDAGQTVKHLHFHVLGGEKLYMTDPVVVEDQSITTAGKQKLVIDRKELDKMSGKRVLVVDDVISTGGSLKALDALAEQTQCTIVGQAAVLAEGDAAERKDIIFLEPLPLFFH